MITRLIYPLSFREKISFRLHRFYKNLKDKNIELEFNKKIRLDLTNKDDYHRLLILNGFYELDLTRSIIELGNKGGVLVDVGANYGYFSLLWAFQNPRNKVIAFEASPLNILPLENNISKNLKNDKIRIIPIAAGKEKGKLHFNLSNEDLQTGWGGFTINNDATIEVEVETLDNFASMNKIEMIDVLKIDTEGADTWVLLGAKRLLEEKKIMHIFFEHNISRMAMLNIGINEAKDFLENLDYTVKRCSDSDYYAYPNNLEVE